MKLPIPPLFGTKEKPEYYLALLLRNEKATAVIIEEYVGKIKIIGKGEEPFTTSIEDASPDELLDVLDRTISRAEETLPSTVEVQKTVFGVKEGWVEEKKIKKEHLQRLKQVCDELGLSPVGFLVIPEAISHLLQKEEGAPVSAVLAEIGKRHVTVTLFRGGKVVESKDRIIEDSIPKTVDTLLKHFSSVEVLPSRIIVFNGKETEQLAQIFITHQWSKSLPFLHVPQISILPPEFDAKAVVFGAATQMGFDVLDSFHVDAQEIKTYHTKAVDKEELEATTAKEPEELEDELDEKITEQEKETNEEVSLHSVPAENFGFVQDQDIAQLADGKTSKEYKKEEEAGGKHDGDDTTDEVDSDRPHHFVVNDPHERSRKEQDDELEEDVGQERDSRQSSRRGSGPSRFAGFIPALFALPGKIPFGALRQVNPARYWGNKVLIFPPLIFLLFIGIALLYIFKIGAIVTINIAPKSADQSEEITFSASGSNDFSGNILAAKEIEVTLNGNVTANATGEKETGEKAKGTVTLFNSSETKRQLSEGTVLISSNGLEFITDKEVIIASASGDIFSGIKSGTADVAVTASEIGTESNLPSGTKFTIEKATGLAARNEKAFSGGSKKKITVVAKKDVESLSKKLLEDLKDDAKQKLDEKASDNQAALPIFTDVSVEKEDFDKKVGDEAKTVKLTGSLKFTTLAYDKKDVLEFAQTVLKSQQDQDVNIPEESIKTELQNVESTKDGDIEAQLAINAGIVPKVDTAKIVQEIKGKSFEAATAIIHDLPQVDTIDIRLSPNIPFLPKYLPRISNNISVVIKTK